MDATRARRTRDRARQMWYSGYRQWCFARFMGFPSPITAHRGDIVFSKLLFASRMH